MQPSQARVRHRFRQDGEVPVEIAETSRGGVRTSVGNGQHAELEQLRSALQQERAAREHAEHALQQARDTLRTLQTQIAHAEIAHKEALAAERRAREVAEHALQDMREKVEAAARTQVQPRRPQPVAERDGKRGREGPLEPEPVQWWVPGWSRRGG